MTLAIVVLFFLALAKKEIANCKIINNECKKLLLVVLVTVFLVLEKNKGTVNRNRKCYQHI
jgi:hypothetical protein